jgi:hypothetical protein
LPDSLSLVVTELWVILGAECPSSEGQTLGNDLNNVVIELKNKMTARREMTLAKRAEPRGIFYNVNANALRSF